MARKLTPTEVYKNLAKRTNESPEKIQFIWENMVEMISEELKYYGVFPFYGMCTIKLETQSGKWIHVPLNDFDPEYVKDEITTKTVYIEARHKLRFIPSEVFKEVVNGERSTKAEKKRLKAIAKDEERKRIEFEKQLENSKKADEIFEKAVKIKRENYLKRKGKWKEKPEDKESNINKPQDY